MNRALSPHRTAAHWIFFFVLFVQPSLQTLETAVHEKAVSKIVKAPGHPALLRQSSKSHTLQSPCSNVWSEGSAYGPFQRGLRYGLFQRGLSSVRFKGV